MQTKAERYAESLHQVKQLLREIDRAEDMADAVCSKGVDAQQQLNLGLMRIRQQLRTDLAELAEQLGVV